MLQNWKGVHLYAMVLVFSSTVVCTLLVVVTAADPYVSNSPSTRLNSCAAQRVIDGTSSDMFHLNLQSRGNKADECDKEVKSPWFDGFQVKDSVTAVTIGHPIRRMLSHVDEESITLREALSWTEGDGESNEVGAQR